ncbi:hypothetical protein lerEdw1_013062 [Lerista edwardsae]|nr:hypothetical protein lerEdw1_013062 [Lerista edwardsae]
MRVLGVAEGSPRHEPTPLSLELPPKTRCGSRPPPEGAGAASGGELSHFERAVKGGWCPSCQAKLADLKRQAATLAAGCNSLGPPIRSQTPDFGVALKHSQRIQWSGLRGTYGHRKILA